MKILFLIFTILISSNCANQISADKFASQPEPSATSNNINSVDTNKPIPSENDKVDKAKRKELEIQNRKFEIVPEEFKKINFENFRFPVDRKIKFITLRDGEYEYKSRGGGETYSLADVYYLDLNSDAFKEALVRLFVVSCGGSCDSGADFFYVYSIDKNKPKMIWHFETGSLGYGMGLKSLTVEDKKIVVEQFGGYIKSTGQNATTAVSSKFYSENTTRTIFGFDGKKISQKKQEVIAVPARSVMNYSPEISVNN